jgi:hypothetical protein
MQDTLKVRGFFRLQVVNEDGSIDSDSGVCENTIVNGGFLEYLTKAIASSAHAGSITHVALGTGTATVATDATSLVGEIVAGNTFRQTVAIATSSKSAQFTATFASGWNSNTSHVLGNIGLYNSSSGGTLFAGNTYTTQNCATNQAVNATYTIAFA